MADNPSIVSSDQASTQTGYSHHLEVALYKTGLNLSLENSDRSHFLHFEDLSVISDYVPQGQKLASLNSLGLIGFVDLGPGYLIVIYTQAPVFEYKNTTIWNVIKSLVIPLKFELARGYFKIDEEIAAQLDELDENLEQPLREVPSQSNNPVADKFNQTKDIFFSKLGVYVNDLKSNPSLSISNKIVTLLDTENENESDEINESEYNSVRVKRSITIKGVPKEARAYQKQNNFTKLFDKIKQQQLDQKTQRYNISNSMLYKFEKQLNNFFSSKDFFYSREFDITKSFTFANDEFQRQDIDTHNSFFFNHSISTKFSQTDLVLPMIQGFVGSIDMDLNLHGSISTRQGKLLLISKRSTKRAGSRYLRRGIDDHSNVANFESTSQILITELNDSPEPLFTKFDIIRGSIPLFFQQNPAFLKPIPTLTRSIEKCSKPFKSHFENLLEKYGSVSCVSLVEKSNREREIGESYEKLALDNNIPFTWFDFHEVCKKMKFDNVSQLLTCPIENGDSTISEQLLDHYKWNDNILGLDQLGVFRVNCIDCLDRTNIVSKYLSEIVLIQRMLPQHNLTIDNLVKFQKLYNNLWADNGDYISRQYASTNALKGDYTRTAKRNYKGLLNDAFLTMSRYYSGYISDYFKQCVVDYLLGFKNKEIFEEFENTLDVLDPNEINENLNKKNSSLKVIIEELGILKTKTASSGEESSDLEQDEFEDLILVGSWSGIYSPMVLNSMKLNNNGPTISIILTNKLIYFVIFDEASSKISKTIKIKVHDIKELHYGAYITSTHSSLSLNPKRNVGLQFKFNSGNEEDDCLVVKFPQDMDYEKVKYIIELISKTCHSSTLSNNDLVSEQEARKNINIVQNLEYKFKKLVWG